MSSPVAVQSNRRKYFASEFGFSNTIFFVSHMQHWSDGFIPHHMITLPIATGQNIFQFELICQLSIIPLVRSYSKGTFMSHSVDDFVSGNEIDFAAKWMNLSNSIFIYIEFISIHQIKRTHVTHQRKQNKSTPNQSRFVLYIGIDCRRQHIESKKKNVWIIHVFRLGQQFSWW